MKIIRNLCVAISLYSRIPMPHFEWEEDDLKHNLVFLPLIGVIIAAVTYGLMRLNAVICLPDISMIIICSLIPLIITGGFHMDGYMDVQDAVRSYKSAEEKLKILKDPHIGAFAVIRTIIYVGIWTAALAVVMGTDDMRYAYLYSVTFVISRVICGMTSFLFPHAKKEGMLDQETREMPKSDIIILVLELMAGCVVAIMLNPIAGCACLASAGVFTLYYRHMCMKQFGGVTGDTAGYYISASEEVMLVVIAVIRLVISI